MSGVRAVRRVGRRVRVCVATCSSHQSQRIREGQKKHNIHLAYGFHYKYAGTLTTDILRLYLVSSFARTCCRPRARACDARHDAGVA